jgi:hypothetical protein
MKKDLAKLPVRERARIESQFHDRNPRDLDERMSHAKRYSPAAIRLPPKLVENLKILAESEGEPEYQAMVKRWIEERLQRETAVSGWVVISGQHLNPAAFGVALIGHCFEPVCPSGFLYLDENKIRPAGLEPATPCLEGSFAAFG